MRYRERAETADPGFCVVRPKVKGGRELWGRPVPEGVPIDGRHS